MTRFRLVAALVVGIVAVALAGSGTGAEPAEVSPYVAGASSYYAAPPAPSAIALIDLNYVLRHHPRFTRMMGELKADVDRAEKQMKSEQQALLRLAERLKKAPPAGSERAALQADFDRREAELKVHVDLQKKVFLGREAKIYQAAYRDVTREVESYAKAHNIAAVFKINRESPLTAKPEDFVRGISSPVVWHSDAMDITPEIVKRVNPYGPSKPVAAGEKPAARSGGALSALLAAASSAADKPGGPPPAVKKEEKPKPEPAKPAEKPAEKAVEKTAEKPAAKKPEEKKEPAKKKATVVRFTLKGHYPEGPSQGGIFADIQPSLARVIQRLDEAAGDKTVAAVWLRIEDLEVGRGKIHELRAAVARLRKAGKPVFAELASGDSAQYLVAAACDQVFMPPSGMLLVPGVRAEVTFYKGLLDKLGLEFDALQMGKYKGAAEPLTRTKMSGPLRESIEAMVDDSYEDIVAAIAADRKLKDYVVKTLIDQGLFTAAAARKAQLIDQVAYADQFEETIRKRLAADQLDLVTTYKKKQVETEFSGIGGLMKLMELMAGGKPSEKPGVKQRVAVVYAVGPIVEGKSVSDIFGQSAVGSATIVEALHKAAEDPKVVAIVLRIDSPGGSAIASDLIWRETVRMKKPLIASMGDVAGSGGYYIAMGARRIIAEPGTITGSIGVIGGKLVTRGLYEKIGLTTEIISRGRNSGSLSSTQPFTEDERKAWTELLTETYGQFVSKAAEGRKMNRSRLEELAQGRVYTGRMAKKLGLVDELGTLRDAVAAAKQAAGLKADEEVELMVLPRPRSIFEQLFGEPSVASDIESAAPELFKMLRQTKLVRQLLSERVLLWMPYGVQMR